MEFIIFGYSVLFIFTIIKYNYQILSLKDRVSFLEEKFKIVYSLLENKDAK